MNAKDEIRRVIEIPHPRERVWQAITDPDQVAQWFSDRVRYELAPGAEMMLEWDEFGRVGGRIETVEPPEQFAFRWRATGVAESEPMTASNSTLVTYLLDELGEGTRLTVSETGFAGLPADLREAAWRENNSGWDAELAELVSYFAGQPA